jgi:hypothetical protein
MIEPLGRQRRGATGGRAACQQNRLDGTLRKSGSSLAVVGFFVDELLGAADAGMPSRGALSASEIKGHFISWNLPSEPPEFERSHSAVVPPTGNYAFDQNNGTPRYRTLLIVRTRRGSAAPPHSCSCLSPALQGGAFFHRPSRVAPWPSSPVTANDRCASPGVADLNRLSRVTEGEAKETACWISGCSRRLL